MEPSQIIWHAIGKPMPFENDGSPIKPRGDCGTCAKCGEPAQWRLKDAISDNFTTVKNASRAWPLGGDALCAACVIVCKWMGLRATLWFARVDGLWFCPLRPIAEHPETRPDALASLLNPPEPPFVAGLPLYGIDHGTEANAGRIVWPGAPLPPNQLVKCQSKHTALYARVSTNRMRYQLQVDDASDITVDVALWRRKLVEIDTVLCVLRTDGVGSQDARASLLTLVCPTRASTTTVARWHALIAPFRSHAQAQWWELLTSLVEMPPLPEKEAKPAKVKPAETKPEAPKPPAETKPVRTQLTLF